MVPAVVPLFWEPPFQNSGRVRASLSLGHLRRRLCTMLIRRCGVARYMQAPCRWLGISRVNSHRYNRYPTPRKVCGCHLPNPVSGKPLLHGSGWYRGKTHPYVGPPQPMRSNYLYIAFCMRARLILSPALLVMT